VLKNWNEIATRYTLDTRSEIRQSLALTCRQIIALQSTYRLFPSETHRRYAIQTWSE